MDAKLVQRPKYDMIDHFGQILGMIIKAGIGGRITAPIFVSSSMFSR